MKRAVRFVLSLFFLLGTESMTCWAAPSVLGSKLLDDVAERADLLNRIGPLSADQMELAKNLVFLQGQLKVNPGNLELRWLRGLCYLELDNYEVAIPDLEFVVLRDPAHVEAKSALALAYNNQAYVLSKASPKEFERALVLIDRAIILEPKESFYRGTRAAVLYQLGRYREALKDLERALRDYPGHKGMVQDLAKIKAALTQTKHSPSIH